MAALRRVHPHNWRLSNCNCQGCLRNISTYWTCVKQLHSKTRPQSQTAVARTKTEQSPIFDTVSGDRSYICLGQTSAKEQLMLQQKAPLQETTTLHDWTTGSCINNLHCQKYEVASHARFTKVMAKCWFKTCAHLEQPPPRQLHQGPRAHTCRHGMLQHLPAVQGPQLPLKDGLPLRPGNAL